ncbi:DNA polymerase thumb domain-containing protein [Acholeplasma hippikon]|uniref:DNA polymerase IV n=1 Tax=Acholeplasma hippikon TaxID=264636 RepID=A0A449BI31_9MOLU|nr:hypothetical protein [Acholeplasma hippikon]VEU82108.1 DNA polymerase IV [Acholeplasma hippikon]
MIDLKPYQVNRNILCIDLKSFYASVECVLRGLDPFTTPLVVADKSRGGGSIVLAVTPYLKSKGVPSRLRIFEIPKGLDPIYAKPRMQAYLEYASKVIEVYMEFISEDDLYVYSIDEAFLDVTHYLAYYQITDIELGKRILARIKEKLGLTATCGVGPNMLLAKLSMDIEAKKSKDFIAKWDYEDVKEKLWCVQPLSEMWGIGHRMEKRLNDIGLYKIGDIANYDVSVLKRKFGILGEELYYHTHGIDLSMIKDKQMLRRESKSFGISQVLFKDYDAEGALILIQEMVDDVTRRLRISRKKCKTVHLGIGYTKAYGGGFSRQLTLEQASSNESVIYDACLTLFDLYHEDLPIRTISVSLTNLTTINTYQYSIFEDANALAKEEQLQYTMDKLKMKFGKNSVLRATSLEKDSTVKDRNKQIGGHHV